MAPITLRAYIREIDGMIDTGQLDEAVEHCRHVLLSYPRYIAAYKALGKAHLEQQRFGDAADVLQRVLSALPDDFIANAGMSQIREDEGNLDSAIWHMERAFESQPSNTAIQEELRRLYGRRDGMAPPKVRLTRGALARMYAKGGLFDQAIAELRLALSEDSQRFDLHVLLAQMYFQNNQPLEAISTCNTILKKLPNCLEANKIMAAILPDTERLADAEVYRKRAIAMDPYFSQTSPSLPASEDVPDAAISLERLVWRPGQQLESGASQPAWAASLGVSFQDTSSDQIPEWLQGEGMQEPAPGDEPQPQQIAPFAWETPPEESIIPEIPAAAEEPIPDWMKEAGWEPSTGTAPEESGMLGLEEPAAAAEGEAAPADIPDWLRDMAPPGALGSETPPAAAEPGGEAALPWLQDEPPGSSDTIVNWLGDNKTGVPLENIPLPASAEEMPEWLKDLEPSPAAAPAASEPPAEMPAPPEPSAAEPSPAGEEGELPDWLAETESPEEATGVTSWLKSVDLGGEQPAAAAEPSAGEESLPDWLKEETPAAPPELAQPDWLAASTPPLAEPPAAPADLPAEPAELLPDWLSAPGETSSAEPAPSEETAISPAPAEAQPAEGLPDWLAELGPTPAELEAAAAPSSAQSEPTSPSDLTDENAALAWLEGLAAQQGAKEEELITPPEERQGAMPEWIKAEAEAGTPPEPEPVAAEEPVSAVETPAEQLPDWLSEITAPAELEAPPVEAEPAAVETPAEELPDWLSEVTAPVEAETPPVEAEPAAVETPAEQLPDWLSEITAPAELEAPPLEPETAAVETPAEELPDWLSEVTAPAELEAPPVEPETAAVETPAEELPDWLSELTAPVEAETPPVEPETAAVETPAEQLTDWLSEITAPAELETPPVETEPAAVETPAEQLPVEEPSAAPAEALPQWLVDMAGPAPVAQPPAGELPVEGVDLSDDAALAWLEGLAARHGAKEEELITPPEARLETMPGWVQAEAESAAPPEAQAAPSEEAGEVLATEETLGEQMPAWLSEDTAPAEPETAPAKEEASQAEELPAWLAEAAPAPADLEAPAVEVAPPVEPAPPVDLTDEAAALAWLEGLAAQQGAKEEELITPPDQRLQDVPDWIKAEAESKAPAQEIPPAETAEVPAAEAEVPEWLAEIPPAVPQVETPAAEVAPTEELPVWLAESAPAETEGETPALEAAPAEQLPEWLQSIETEAAAEEAPEWLPEAVRSEDQPASEEVPTWITAGEASQPPAPGIDLNTASLSELESLPGVGFILAQNILAFREARGPFTSLDDLQQVEGVTPDLLEQLRAALGVAVPAAPAEAPAARPGDPQEAVLFDARQALARQDVPAAAAHYTTLVRQSLKLPEIISDLQEAIYRFPLDINLWQTLGDAYLRQDQLKNALDAYTKAEELLR